MIPVIEASLGEDRDHADDAAARRPVQRSSSCRRRRCPFTGTAGWGKDYPDAFTYYLYLFDGRAHHAGRSTTTSRSSGSPQEQAQKIGIDYAGRGRAERRRRHRRMHRDRRRRPSASTCWGDLDKKLMEEVVPWVPYIWRNNSVIIADTRHAVGVRPGDRATRPGCTSRSTRRSSSQDRRQQGRAAPWRGRPSCASPVGRRAEREMGAYIVRRFIWAVFVVLIVTLITFFIFFLMPPGDPALRFAGKSPTPETLAAVREQFGLDGALVPAVRDLRQTLLHRRRVGLARPRLLVRHPGLRA